MAKLKNETKVGFLVFATLIIAGFFSWLIGVQNPFSRSVSFYVTYRFAGGIEIGSPVRVSGIKVGRVEKIEFFVPKTAKVQTLAQTEPGSADYKANQAVAPLRVKVSVQKDAVVGIRQDSRFYINLAGIIGERYIEITPGSLDVPQVTPGDTFAGIDPPRIDQLLSQSFDLAGKIAEIVERNKGDITRSVELLYKLSNNLNQTLNWLDKSALFKTDLSKLVDNLISITSDVRRITEKSRTPEGEKTLKLLHELLWRLEPLDSENIRKFLQKEGVKVHLF